jgi:primosomal protein N' (replication factor Y)
VSLVGVVAADLGLHMPDFRAAERTFQLLTQVAGRAGRGSLPGHVVLQTRHPDHPALLAASRHDYERFAEAELAERAAAGYPPSTRLVSFLVSGPREERVIESVERLAEWASEAVGGGQEVEVLGPAPHVWTKLRGRFRWHVTLRSARRRLLLESASRLEDRLEQEKQPAGVRVVVDVDPQDVL